MSNIRTQRPEVGILFDTDGEQAAASRRRALEMAVADGLMVAGMHLHFPGFCRVARHGEGYYLVPELWVAD